ncbi:hypothetical protein Tdes44962_MAKER06088 [Teratosphaeria destructans]|uniref:Uncharacterized protein n=1 Tax=Teratosphaeria destructans TaxID=418781 RepID=A0A9W7SIQ0_9PEZI|nr:hypothetical protein Tdes44962_MAKER06088 [Teratosphaeria destructans]
MATDQASLAKEALDLTLELERCRKNQKEHINTAEVLENQANAFAAILATNTPAAGTSADADLEGEDRENVILGEISKLLITSRQHRVPCLKPQIEVLHQAIREYDITAAVHAFREISALVVAAKDERAQAAAMLAWMVSVEGGDFDKVLQQAWGPDGNGVAWPGETVEEAYRQDAAKRLNERDNSEEEEDGDAIQVDLEKRAGDVDDGEHSQQASTRDLSRDTEDSLAPAVSAVTLEQQNDQPFQNVVQELVNESENKRTSGKSIGDPGERNWHLPGPGSAECFDQQGGQSPEEGLQEAVDRHTSEAADQASQDDLEQLSEPEPATLSAAQVARMLPDAAYGLGIDTDRRNSDHHHHHDHDPDTAYEGSSGAKDVVLNRFWLRFVQQHHSAITSAIIAAVASFLCIYVLYAHAASTSISKAAATYLICSTGIRDDLIPSMAALSLPLSSVVGLASWAAESSVVLRWLALDHRRARVRGKERVSAEFVERLGGTIMQVGSQMKGFQACLGQYGEAGETQDYGGQGQTHGSSKFDAAAEARNTLASLHANTGRRRCRESFTLGLVHAMGNDAGNVFQEAGNPGSPLDMILEQRGQSLEGVIGDLVLGGQDQSGQLA